VAEKLSVIFYTDKKITGNELVFTKTAEDRNGISVVKGKVTFTNGKYLLRKAAIKHKVNDESCKGKFIDLPVFTPHGFWQWLDLLVWENRIVV